MINIAICDDEIEFLQEFKNIIIKDNSFDGNYKIDLFTSGTDLLNNLGLSYDVIFLDIQMPGLDGNVTSEKLRETDKNALLIFTTAVLTPLPKIFKVNPFRYLVKPFDNTTLPLELSEIWKEITARKETVVFNCTNGIFAVKISSILYLSINRKYVDIVTDTEILSCKEKLSNLATQLIPFGFAFSHKSYLVNCRRIFSINKYIIVLDNKSKIPISQPKAVKFKKDFADYAKSMKWGN